MIALTLREFHQFQAAGRQFLYLVPSAAVFELDLLAEAVLRVLSEGPRSEDAVIESLADRFPAPAVSGVIAELRDVRAIGYQQQPDPKEPKFLPMVPFPLSTMVFERHQSVQPRLHMSEP